MENYPVRVLHIAIIRFVMNDDDDSFEPVGSVVAGVRRGWELRLRVSGCLTFFVRDVMVYAIILTDRVT